MKYVNFKHFLQFKGMTIEFSVYHIKFGRYRVTATLILNGRTFSEYDCEGHFRYFLELLSKYAGIEATANDIGQHVSKIANYIQGWELSYPE
jgi:hypothetical protein